MGAAGTGIFADDLACDVRDRFRELTTEGCKSAEATARIQREYRREAKDRDDGPIFWLALAATQWDLGRLDEKVKVRALSLIDDGTALRRWNERNEESRGESRRAKALEALRKKLSSQPPQAKAIRKSPKKFVDSYVWPVGGVFAYRLASGRKVLVLVVDVVEHPKGSMTIFAFLDWIGKQLPIAARIRKLPLRDEPGHENDPYDPPPFPSLTAISRTSDEVPATDRVEWTKVKRDPHKEPSLRRRFRGGEHVVYDYGFAQWDPPGPKIARFSLSIDDLLKKQFDWS